jgi:eukaryotic-like serine/threonine-protein kinase
LYLSPGARVVGQKINNYELKELLGEGGMGAVYVAEHPVLGRRVAIKILRRDLVQDSKLVGRFLNEARAADAIRHPNIVQVNDVGLLPDGLPYIVMELLEGQTLGSRINAAGHLSVGEALAFAGQAAGAVAAAHAEGIVHRDLKPDNLFLVADPVAAGGQRVKVLDFGIAKLRAELGGSDLRTKTGAVMGTPAYMSPEQCLGRSGDVDHRTDVYALGVILFEMLCGSPPFVGEGFGEVLVMHMTQPPPTPSTINPDIPPALEAVIMRALAKRKEDRFATMDEMNQALAAAGKDPATRTEVPVRSGATASGMAIANMTGYRRQPTPVRPTTTLSAAAGPMEGSPSQSMDELRPASSRRGGLIVAGVAAVAAAVGLFALVPRGGEVPAGSHAGASAPAAAVAPIAVPPPVAARIAEPARAAGETPPPAAKPGDNAPAPLEPDKADKPGSKTKGSDKKSDKAKPADNAPTPPPGARPRKREKDAPVRATGHEMAAPPSTLPVTPPTPAPVTAPREVPPPPPERLEKL